MRFISIEKANETTADVLLLQLFFTSDFAVLLMGEQKYFLLQCVGYSSYATGKHLRCLSIDKGFQTPYSTWFKIVRA